jgi:hypothetical protein
MPSLRRLTSSCENVPPYSERAATMRSPAWHSVSRPPSARPGRWRRPRGAPALQRGDALLEGRHRRVADARIDVAEGLQVEQAGGVLGRIEDEGAGLVDRQRARAGRRVRLGAGMQAEGFDAVVCDPSCRGFGGGLIASIIAARDSTMIRDRSGHRPMFLLKKILTALILPPTGPVLLALFGLWLSRRKKSALAVRRFAAGDDLAARSDCPGHAGGRQCPDGRLGAAGADQRRGNCAAPRPSSSSAAAAITPRRNTAATPSAAPRWCARATAPSWRANQAAGAGHQRLAARRPGRGGLDARGAGTRIRRQGALGRNRLARHGRKRLACRRRCSRPMASPASRW